MLLLIAALSLTLAPLVLPLTGRTLAGGSVLLFILYTRLSDLGIDTHGIAPVDPKGLSLVAQVSLLALTALIFARRSLGQGSRSLASCRWAWMGMALYLAVLYASSVWAPDEGMAAGQAASLLKNLLIVYVVAELFDTPGAQRTAIWALLAAGALMAGLTILQAASHTFDNTYLGLAQAPIRQIVGTDNSFRSSGPIGDPNFYALVLAALLPLALFRVRDERALELRIVALTIAALLVGAIVLTYSRGGLVTLVVAAVLTVLLLRVRLGHLAAITILLLPLLLLVLGVYWQRIGTLAQGDNATLGRAGSQEVALAIFEDHPLLGVGANNYTVTYFPYAMRLNEPWAAENPHNLYLAIAAETGLAGVLTFSASMLLILRLAWRRRAAAMIGGDRLVEGMAASCLLAVLTYLIGVIFLPIAYPRYLWVLVGLVLAVSISQETIANQPTLARMAVARG